MKKSIILLSFAFLIIGFVSCKNGDASKVEDPVKTEKVIKIVKATDLNGKEYTSAYICPMYCVGSGSDKPGKCPACKMDYVKNPKSAVDSHEGHDHSGHDHSGHNH